MKSRNDIDVQTRKWEPTPAQRKFAEEYVKGGMKDATAAYRIAYPNNKGKYIKEDAWRALRHPNIRQLIEEIQQDSRSQFVVMAPEAIDRLLDLAMNAQSEKVRLEANVEIIDRAGLKPPDKVELHHLGVFGDLGTDDIRNMIRKNLEKAD